MCNDAAATENDRTAGVRSSYVGKTRHELLMSAVIEIVLSVGNWVASCYFCRFSPSFAFVLVCVKNGNVIILVDKAGLMVSILTIMISLAALYKNNKDYGGWWRKSDSVGDDRWRGST